jgi:hypothetical protein
MGAAGVAGILALCAGTSSTALAEDADKLVEDANALIAKGDYESACPKLRAAEAAKPSLATLRALAECDDKADNAAQAWQEYGDLVDAAKAAYEDDLSKKAEERRKAIAAGLAKMTILVPRSSQLQYSIELDGVVLNADRIGAELLVDSGTHHLKVSTNGGPETQMDADFELPGNMSKSTVKVPLDKPNEVNGPAPAAPAGPQVIYVQGPGQNGGSNAAPEVRKENMPGVAAIGGVLLGLGLVSGVFAMGYGIASIFDDDADAPAIGCLIGSVVGIGVGIPLLVVGLVKRPVSNSAMVPSAIPEITIGTKGVAAKWAF